MKYCIITESQLPYQLETEVMGRKVTTAFVDIEEEDKYIQLEYACYNRFKDNCVTNPNNNNQVFNLLNHNEWLKLIPQSDDKVSLDVPSLLLSI